MLQNLGQSRCLFLLSGLGSSTTIIHRRWRLWISRCLPRNSQYGRSLNVVRYCRRYYFVCYCIHHCLIYYSLMYDFLLRLLNWHMLCFAWQKVDCCITFEGKTYYYQTLVLIDFCRIVLVQELLDHDDHLRCQSHQWYNWSFSIQEWWTNYHTKQLIKGQESRSAQDRTSHSHHPTRANRTQREPWNENSTWETIMFHVLLTFWEKLLFIPMNLMLSPSMMALALSVGALARISSIRVVNWLPVVLSMVD